jgi:hypothetical protein
LNCAPRRASLAFGETEAGEVKPMSCSRQSRAGSLRASIIADLKEAKALLAESLS